MTRTDQHSPQFRSETGDGRASAAQVPEPRFEWAGNHVRPLAEVSHVDVSDFQTMEIPRIVD